MSTPNNDKPLIWTLENTEPDPPPDDVKPPFRDLDEPPSYRSRWRDDPGSYRVRHPGATIDTGQDLVGDWDVDAVNGLIILSIGLAPSQFVTDDCPAGRVRVRLWSEWPRQGIKFKDLAAIKVARVREVIRERMEEGLVPGGYFYVPEGKEVSPLVERQIAGVRTAAGAKLKTGRPRTTDTELDQWASDVIKCVSDKSRPLYKQLVILWHVEDSTVKNHRLPLLRSTGRISGKGPSITEGPNYRKEKTDG